MSESRRRLLRGLGAAGLGAVVAKATLPDSWIKPVVNSVVVPLHAQGSPGGNPYAGTYVASLATAGVGTSNCVTYNNEIVNLIRAQVQIVIDSGGGVSASVMNGAMAGSGTMSGNSFSFAIASPAPFDTTNITGCQGSGNITGTVSGSTISGSWTGSGTCAVNCSTWGPSPSASFDATLVP